MSQPVELFGVLRELAGVSQVSVDITPPASVARLLEALVVDYPALEPHLPRVVCAVGEDVRSRADTVEAGETLVLLPPVSGG